MKKRKRCRWLIDPRVDMWIAYWDLVTTVALLFTAVVTPFEVAFLEPPPVGERMANGLYMSNRVVDLVFIFDMFLQFRTAIKVSSVSKGTFWVVSPGSIARHYLASKWFLLDSFSIATSLFDIVELPAGGQSLTVLRAVRALRLAKLVRLAKGSRVFKSWEMRVSINFNYLSLCQVSVMIVFGCHWFACIWGLQASFDPLNTWPGSKDYCVRNGEPLPEVMGAQLPTVNATTGEGCPPGWNCDLVTGISCVDGLTMYVYSLYFTSMTITSVGYGDIAAQPFNVSEQITCTAIMLFSGMIWGYLIGTFCSLAANLSPSTQLFRGEISRLNEFMSTYLLHPRTRYRLREFMYESAHLRGFSQQQELLRRLSPAMQGEVLVLINRRYFNAIWYVRSIAHPGVLMALSSALTPIVFPPSELTPAGFLYIIQRGSAYWGGRILRESNAWGDDVLLADRHPSLVLDFPAVAITYLAALCIHGSLLAQVLSRFPQLAAAVHRLRTRWAVRRAIVRAAERAAYARGVAFRDRFQPIYAKEITWAKMQAALGRAAGKPPPRLVKLPGTHSSIPWRRRSPRHVGPMGGVDREDLGFDEVALMQAAKDYGLEMRGAQLRDQLDENRQGEAEQIRALTASHAAMQAQLNRIEALLLQRGGHRAAADPAGADPANSSEEAPSSTIDAPAGGRAAKTLAIKRASAEPTDRSPSSFFEHLLTPGRRVPAAAAAQLEA